MTFPANPAERSPKGDHNRRLALGTDIEEFAANAGVTVGELKHYELTAPDDTFDQTVAQKVGAELERLEAKAIAKVENGPKPRDAEENVAPALRAEPGSDAH